MAKLKIYNDITDEETKVVYEYWFGTESVCFKDVKEFVENIPEDDNDIDLYLHCRGGNCTEGWAMYDTLRTSGKRITAVVDGMCASMASVLLMAAPKERRFAQKNASICIHNPYYEYLYIDKETAHADDVDDMAKRLQIQAEELRQEQKRILNLYVERTGTDAETLQALMDEDKFIDMNEALKLGLIGEILEPNTDKSLTKKTKNMNKNKVTVEASVFDRMLRKLGIRKVEDFKVIDQVVTDVTGAELTVELDEVDPQEGDVASPDGEFTMEDGTGITVANGVISEIKKPDEEEDDDNDDDDDNNDDDDNKSTDGADGAAANQNAEDDAEGASSLDSQAQDLQEQVSSLTAENATLKELVSSLTAENASLKENVKSEEDKAILSKVASLGGKQWLDMASKVSSTFTPVNRRFEEHKETKEEKKDGSIGADFLNSFRAKKKTH